MSAVVPPSRLRVTLAGIELQNPILLASGTAGYGRELADVISLDALGGLVTKAVSLERRPGAAAPRVVEFDGGMLNAVGLANPGVDEVRTTHLPWLFQHVTRARVLINVVGNAIDDFAGVIARLEDAPGKAGYELNVSCPNVKAGGLEFGGDPHALRELVRSARSETRLPLFVKLSPTLSDPVEAAQVALEAGADGLTLVNTLPGLLIDVERRRPVLGFGTGGISGAALLPVGVLATAKVYRATKAPLIGAGGVSSAQEALQYFIAGATSVAIGTAALRDPRVPERIISDLASWCEVRGIDSIHTLTGSLEWDS
jgi:dihydroorotate dehydrogenase (NAD+) catalytic subunit